MSYYFELRKLGIELPRKGGQVKTKCPRCGDLPKHAKRKDLSVNIDKGLYQCKSASCDFSGNVSFKKKEYRRPPKLPTDIDVHPAMIKFARKRGISLKTVKEQKWSVTKDGNVTFNYFRNGERINAKWIIEDEVEGKRVKSFRQIPGAEHILYNLDSLSGKKVCIWVEGEVDVDTLIDAGLHKKYGIISIDQGAGQPGDDLGGKLDCIRTCADELDKIEKHIFMMDKDAPGQYTQSQIIRRVGETKSFIATLPEPYKDANDVWQDDTYDKPIKIATLKKAIEEAKEYEISGAVTLDEEIAEKMLEYYDKGSPKGLSTGVEWFDNHFRIVRGQMTIVMGYPNQGKGTVIRWLIVCISLKHGLKWSCFADEDMPPENFYEDIANIYLGKPTITDNPTLRATREEYEEAIRWAKDNFFLIMKPPFKPGKERERATHEYINSRIEYFRLKYGATCFYKDPMFKIARSEDNVRREDLYWIDVMESEHNFCRGYDVCFYVDHPNPPKSANSKTALPPPLPHMIHGGGMKHNASDNFWIVHLMMNKELKVTHTLLWFYKVRDGKRVGRPGQVNMEFDTEGKSGHFMKEGVSALLKIKNEFLLKQGKAKPDEWDLDDNDLPF